MKRQFDIDALTALVPLVYRSRDAELVERGDVGPLQSLLEVLAGQIAVLEDGLASAYDDLFIETCAPWLVPYIGDAIGYVPLPGDAALSERARVAHAIAYRRRKGTTRMLHQSVCDATGWGAHVVEYARRVASTQDVARTSSGPSVVDVRATLASDPSDEVFATTRHTVDVRRIGAGRGRFGTANVGVHLWRLRSYALRDVAATPAHGHEGRAFRLHPLGVDTQLFAIPTDMPPFSGAGAPESIALPLSRERLQRELRTLYGTDAALSIVADGRLITPDEILVRSLRGRTPGAWATVPSDRFCIDPELGRLVVPHRKHPLESVDVSFAYGFTADIGGGPYDRSLPPADAPDAPEADIRFVHDGSEALASALQSLATHTVVEIASSQAFASPPPIALQAGAHLTVRASVGVWPALRLAEPLRVTGKAGSRLTLSGLAIGEAGLVLEGELDEVRLFDCTLAPPDRRHRQVALTARAGVRRVVIERSITGSVVAAADVELDLRASIVDAGSRERSAIAGPDTNAGPLRCEESTVLGTVDTVALEASDSLFAGVVRSQRFQTGCVRYSYLAPGSVVPQRFECIPHDARDVAVVHFTSLQYGSAGYARLSPQTSHAVRRGAADGEEVGAFHAAATAGREAALAAVLDDAVPLGLHVGVRYLT